ncbi:hypothetical protein CspeluHIS016_0500600 [Cutaneotrichosporon spelunceum]|uniref:Uncharacterized protein n=1 Tax=Cutaneotrichosporon spelunceum TaxID=1672016 RepID=A0AAD3YDC5_9TREE|nr:hypothetical protein CspeluHIS016_0500600 [Cutaneotrichosporon spelunceum]
MRNVSFEQLLVEALPNPYPELESKTYRAGSSNTDVHRSPRTRAAAAFVHSPTLVEEQEVANALTFDMACHHTASSPACDVADEEVILVPQPGRGQDYLNCSIDVYDDMSSLPSPAASTVSRDVTSPAPISQANSPFNNIQFTVAPNNANNSRSIVDVDRQSSSPFSVYSTPSTAIPSPYNTLIRGGAPPLPRRYDHSVTTLSNPQSRVVSHAPNTMTWVNGAPFVGTPPPPPPPSRWTTANGHSFANTPPPAQSRWSKAPQDLPKDYFGGPGFAPVRPSTLGFSRKQTMMPASNYRAAPAPMPVPHRHQAQSQPTGYLEAPIGFNPSDLDSDYPVAMSGTTPPRPPPFVDRSAWHHSVARLDEKADLALAYWFTGLIVNRLAYPNASTMKQSSAKMTMGQFDPYHVVSSGHSYSDGHIVVATELVHHMYKVINRIKTAEIFVAAIYFLDRLALHDVDGHHGSEFRTHLIPRRAGDVRFALERRVTAVIISLAHNTLEDRDFHLPNNMMWEIGEMERTRFNLLKKHALQDMEWDVNLTSEAWRKHVTQVSLALYPPDPCCSTATVVLPPEHREILSSVFAFMWDTANALCYERNTPSSSPATVALPPMSRECSMQGYNYGHGRIHNRGQSPGPKARDFAYDEHTDPYRTYPDSDSRWHRSPFDYAVASAHETRGFADRAPQHSLSSQPTYGTSSVRGSLDFGYTLPYPQPSNNPAPPSHAFAPVAHVNLRLEETYVSRTASQEARARKAQDAYMLEQEARARRAAETRALEEQAQRQRPLVFNDHLQVNEVPHVASPADTADADLSAEHFTAAARLHRREVTKQMRTKELRAKRARALYLQRTYGPRSRNMILA